MRKKILLMVLSMITLLLSGCSTVAKMGMISSRNIDYSASYMKGSVVESKAELMMLLFIPVKMDDTYFYEVLDKALEKEGYDFMTDVTIEKTLVYTVVFDYMSYSIRGTGWKKKDSLNVGSAGKNDPSTYLAREVDGHVEVEKTSLKPQ